MNDDIFGKISPPIKGLGGDPETIIGVAAGAGLKIFFVAAGITALIFLLRGSINWISSGGDKEKVAEEDLPQQEDLPIVVTNCIRGPMPHHELLKD